MARECVKKRNPVIIPARTYSRSPSNRQQKKEEKTLFFAFTWNFLSLQFVFTYELKIQSENSNDICKEEEEKKHGEQKSMARRLWKSEKQRENETEKMKLHEEKKPNRLKIGEKGENRN